MKLKVVALALVTVLASACGQVGHESLVFSTPVPTDLVGTFVLKSLSDCQGSYVSYGLLPSNHQSPGGISTGDSFRVIADGNRISFDYQARTLGGHVQTVVASDVRQDLVEGRRSTASGHSIVIKDNYSQPMMGIPVDTQNWKIDLLSSGELKISVQVMTLSIFLPGTSYTQECVYNRVP